jgi:hypothetical protein
VLSGDGVASPYNLNLLDLGLSVAESFLALNLPGVEAGEVKTLENLHQVLASASESEQSMVADIKALNLEEEEENEKEEVRPSVLETWKFAKSGVIC